MLDTDVDADAAEPCPWSAQNGRMPWKYYIRVLPSHHCGTRAYCWPASPGKLFFAFT
jgi:hypothetical protein